MPNDLHRWHFTVAGIESKFNATSLRHVTYKSTTLISHIQGHKDLVTARVTLSKKKTCEWIFAPSPEPQTQLKMLN